MRSNSKPSLRIRRSTPEPATPYDYDHFVHDQAAVNTLSHLPSSSAGSMSRKAKVKYAWDHDDDDQSTVSFYSSYTTRTDGERMSMDSWKQRSTESSMLSSENYTLPTDVEEWDRLDKQHRAIKLGMGALYPAPEVVRAVLAPQHGVIKRIVDLGCGTGIWSTEMAREFPHCEVLGIDLAPVPLPPESLPPNCQFEVDDISLGLEHLRGQFHCVFARAIGLGLKDFRKTLSDMESCATPGGIVIWMDGDDFYSGFRIIYRPFWSSKEPNGSYSQRILYELRRAAEDLGQSDVQTMEKVIDEGFWANSATLDPSTCKTATLYLPVGTWCNEGDDQTQKDRVKYVGMLMRQDVSEASISIEPLLVKIGWSQETAARWTAGMRDECQNDRLGLRFRMAWGRRRAGPNLPAPALPAGNFITEEERQTTKYPFYDVFDTPAQASAAAEIRNRRKNIPPPPLPSHNGPE